VDFRVDGLDVSALELAGAELVVDYGCVDEEAEEGEAVDGG